VRFFPKSSPDREGTIPILVGGTSGRALRRAATRGDGWHPILLLPEDLLAGMSRYHTLCDEAGRPRGKVVYRHLAGYPPSELEGWPFAGNPEQQANQLREYARTGIDEIVFDATVLSEAASGADEIVAQLEAFVSNTLPIFRALD
jgi:alkanesulfonate monooxygenase SsuD/methylene tetrahydromethanopterin reductase-like flavin-dependent oxidoreductase (luciferase family)